jgi:hypothetical protein
VERQERGDRGITRGLRQVRRDAGDEIDMSRLRSRGLGGVIEEAEDWLEQGVRGYRRGTGDTEDWRLRAEAGVGQV